MRATHTDYKHPRHLRVETGVCVLCVSPSSLDYDRLNRANLPKWPVPRGDSLTEQVYQSMKAARR